MGRSRKETNTYRFQNFSERILRMHIDVVHRIKKKTEEDDAEDSTYFGDALSKWVDLNVTQNFADFKEDMSNFPCSRYVQLVHHAEDIVTVLKKHLVVENTLALEPLLDLVVQMARDMGLDFCAHFQEVFEILVKLLNANAKDADTLEKVFVTMAYLYKFLWRYLVKNIYSVYGYFSSLLTENNKEYIQRFAAESFAFLMRKVKDPDALLSFLFMDLEKYPEKTEGVGQLLFEMMKGVKEHFHTISGQVFRSILWKLGPPQSSEKELPLDLVEETISRMMRGCASYTNREHAGHMWLTLLDMVTEVQKACRSNRKGTEHVKHLCRLLRMMDIWLKHNKGSIVSDPSAVAKVASAVLKELPEADKRESLATDLLTVVSSLLLHSSDCLSVETTARLVVQVCSADFTFEQVREFSLSLISSPLFEKDVLPGLLQFLSQNFDTASPSLQRDMMFLLADIVLQKSTHPEDGSQLHTVQKYSLDFGRALRGHKSGLVKHMQQVADQEDNRDSFSPTDKDKMDELLAAVVCLPHVNTLDASTVTHCLGASWQYLKKTLSLCPKDYQDAVLFVMYQTITSLLVVRSEVEIHDTVPFLDVIMLLKAHPDNYSVLHAADLYMTLMSDLDKDDLFTPNLLVELYTVLEPNLVSWSHKVRQSTLHILTLFPVSIPVPVQQDMKTDEEEEEWTIFTVALAVEKVPVSAHDYRQKLMYLRRLDHSFVHSIMPAGPFSKMPLQYLMGTLLCPLTLLWEPLCELIATHARGMERDAFWEPFQHWTAIAAAKSVEYLPMESDTTTQQTLLDKWMATGTKSERQPDYQSFRNCLWKAMSLFPEKCEPKSRDLVPLFLSFLQKEYYLNDLSVAPTQDIQLESASDDAEDMGQDDTLPENEEEEEAEEEETHAKVTSNAEGKAAGKVKRKSAVQSLLAHLQLFAKMINPRSLHKEAELKEVYFKFLEHKNSKVQKVAFECLLTYKYKFLTPYRENFERLLDDKTFKNEVVLFSIDEENTDISPEHRQDLLPFLMRILFGKMMSKSGPEARGKRRVDTCRSIVFRFLAGCSSTEIRYFLDLAFGPFKHYHTAEPLKMVKELSDVNIKSVVPPKQLKGVIGVVQVVMDKLGSLLHGNASSILHVLLGVTATCAGCLQHRAVIKQSAASILKSVRQMAFSRLMQFLRDFDQYQYTEEESDAILEAFVWPQLQRLSLESKCQPSMLLKLLQCWCQDPKCFFLLTKETAEGDNSPLKAMFSLLTTPGIGRPVSSVILKAVESLLEGEEDTEEEPLQKKRKIVKESKSVSEGTLMVVPHVPSLLTFLESSMRNLDGQLKGGATKDTILELKILARVSIHIEDPAQSLRLCSMLMPLLGGPVQLQQELEESTLETVLNLMSVVKDPRPFFRPVVPLFNNIERRQSRVLLCQILKVIGTKVPDFDAIADIVEKLNAWNPRQAEEPDYTLRLETFRSVVQQLKCWTAVDVDFMLPLIYNCCFFIRAFDDLSLRDNSTLCMITMVQRFKALTSDLRLYKEVMVGIILNHLKKGLRSKQQGVRHEFLAILQAMVVAFPDQREFQGLSGLHDTDIDSDFFENIRHIQIHKQAKALRRLSHYLHSHKLRADQHMGFFVPLLYSYILDKHYSKSGKILDAAVDLMCMMCRQLPWENYYQLLRLYLSHLPRYLDNQRIIVKVIVAILDGFHFDLSQSQFKIDSRPNLKEQSEKTDGEQQEAQEETDEVSLETLDAKSEKKEEEAVTPKKSEFSADRKDLCPPGLATRIHRMVLQSLIPQLHTTLTKKVRTDEIHKLAQAKFAEDEEILRVPIAMAMIKLLQKMPDGALNYRLPGIVLRVCNFLKSRAQDIRTTARDTLVKAVQSIGPKYLPFVIKEMKQALTRGYQLHVLSFSAFYLVRNMTSILKPGDLDPALEDLQIIFQEELFGAVAEEKGVEAITSKLFEAKTIKGYLAYKLMAQYISPDCLGALVQPLKKLLEGTHSQRTANKVRIALQSITNGLLSNRAMTIQTFMVFIHSLTADNLPLLREEKVCADSKSSQLPKPQKPDSCLLFAKAIPRGGAKPKSNKKTTLDVLVEFGLVLLHSSLKKNLQSDNVEHLGYLEPLIPSLVECLSIKYVKVNSAALRCFEWLLTFPLPTLRKQINRVAQELFVLLRNYTAAGAAKGENQELVHMCFKTVTVLVREVKYHKLSSEHLQVLLTYCEEDVHDHTRHSTAFSVIKAILKRKLDVPQLHELLSTLETMTITSENNQLQVQCREVILQYLKSYPLGKKLEKHFGFFICQLNYEYEAGRMSALKMLRSIFSSFDEEILEKYAGLFFLPLSTSMFADQSKTCREMAASTIKTLLEKVDMNSRDQLYSLAVRWLSEEKLTLCCVGIQLCGLFVEVETSQFTSRRQDIFPLVLEKDITSQSESDEDRFFFLLMMLIRKLMNAINIKTLSAWTDINKLLDYVQSHLLHNHSWVRLLTCQIMGQVLSTVGRNDITTYLSPVKAKELVKTLCVQLQSPLLDEELALQVMKNMVFLAKAYHSTDTEDETAITVPWMARKLIKEANLERINNAAVTIKRNHVFKWFAFVSKEFDADIVSSILKTVLPALQREADEVRKDEKLKELAIEVMDWLKKKTGVEAFSEAYTSAQRARKDLKEKRKQKRAITAVVTPEISAAKKMKKNKNRKKPVKVERLKRIKKSKLTVYDHKN